MTDTLEMRTDPQRLRALEHANTIRLARAELKRRIAAGGVSAADVILDCPEAAARWTVAELLLSQPRWGNTRARKFLERNGVSEIKPIGSLTERQRRLLAEQLSKRPPAAPTPIADPSERDEQTAARPAGAARSLVCA
jgi:hypothetical protein